MGLRRFFSLSAWGGLLIFLAMAISVISGLTQACDQSVSETIKRFHQPLVDQLVIFLTKLNSPLALLLVTLIMGVMLLYKKRKLQAVIFVAGLWGTALATTLVKELVKRPRPTDRLVEIHSPSFPSWHSATSMALALLFLAWLYPRYKNRAFPVLLWPLLIGLSRIWLNAHWCSDVLAGWALGAFVTSTILFVYTGRKSYSQNS
ncbi:phosphoesterase PA-phosphatase related protein [Nitratifractor salsuginis DSM 16511]|uniref:Phosphoesterase PA-phosphatase related protein n=2 Tax=Nitratifractor salsuginis TaxID=269261 RepID=E6X3C9_NITSE|nr:phosphoesterase PA-phosphatase related protein [Nitratifractor salsuginis DSM 16511]